MDCSTGGSVQNKCRRGGIKCSGTTVAVCRNHLGEYQGSSAFIIRGLIDMATLEAIACREALSLMEDLGLQHLAIASDCLTVINHIKEVSGGNYGGVVKEIRTWNTIFNSCTYIRESRVYNVEPHKLASHVVQLD